jgi:hypothetical protein
VTSNQAALWYSLRRCGIRDNVMALGQLFQLDLPQADVREPTTVRQQAAVATVAP